MTASDYTKNYTVVMISGKQGSGKSSLQKALTDELRKTYDHEVGVFHFAAPIYRLHDLILSQLETDGMNVNLYPEGAAPYLYKIDGALLQLLGTDWARNTRGAGFWLEYAKKSVSILLGTYVKTGLMNTHPIIIFDDCRFPNEIEAWPDCVKIRLECSEDVRRTRAKKWRSDVNHESEVALDQWKFDLTLDTEKHDQRYNLQSALSYLKLRINDRRVR